MDAPFLSLAVSNLVPALALHSFAMHLGWALVLSAIAAFLLRPFPKALRFFGIGIAAATQLLPGSWSLGWWLGLAFQSPSLTMQGISLLYLVRVWRLRNTPPTATIDTAAYARWPTPLLLVAAIAGWVLVLDMLAQFDLQLFAIGFTPYAVLASLLIAGVFELWSLRSGYSAAFQKYRDIALIIVGAMAVHLLLRLPSGNAWDALIDPWLWLGAQAAVLYRALTFIVFLMRAAAKRTTTWIGTRFGGLG